MLTVERNLDGETYTFTALDGDGNDVERTEKTYAADLQVTDFQNAALKHGKSDEEDIGIDGDFTEAVITVENHGTAPAILGNGHMAVTDGVPSPSDPMEAKDGGFYSFNAIQPDEQREYSDSDCFVFYESRQGDWPEDLRTYGEFPDDYENGGFTDEVTVRVGTATAIQGHHRDRVRRTYANRPAVPNPVLGASTRLRR